MSLTTSAALVVAIQLADHISKPLEELSKRLDGISKRVADMGQKVAQAGKLGCWGDGVVWVTPQLTARPMRYQMNIPPVTSAKDMAAVISKVRIRDEIMGVSVHEQ